MYTTTMESGPENPRRDGLLVPLSILVVYMYMGGCQNYGPFLGSYYNTAPRHLLFRVPKKGP